MKKNVFCLCCLGLSANMLFAPLAGAAERADVPEQYKWNTTDLYPSEADWTAQSKTIAADIAKLPQLQGTLGASPENFYSALDKIFKVSLALDRLYTYASMRADEDTRLSDPRVMVQTAGDLAVKLSAATAFLRPEILALGEKKVKVFLAREPGLVPYEPWLDDVLRFSAHTLNASEEKIAAQAGTLESAPSDAYEIFTNADLPYPEITLEDGSKVRLDASAYTQYRAAANRADREKVFQSFWSKYKEFERTLGTTLYSHLKTHVFNKDVHKFGSSLEAALFGTNVPTQVYKQLIADVHANLSTLHRYLKLRKKMMGVDELKYSDLYVPLVSSVEKKYTPEEAKDLVLKSVAPLGPQYVADLKTGFDNRWVDFIPTTGKKSGAYSTGVYGVHPYQLQNFTGLYDEVSTVAHESGHSMHTFLSDRNQPYPTHDYKIFVAEVASTLNENLLLHYMLAQNPDRDTRLFLLGNYLEGLRTTLFRQTLFAEFEMLTHEMADKGEPITGDRFTSLYLGLLRQYYGDKEGVCKVDDLYGIEWAYIPHFYYNFYVYQYATSIIASQKIAADMRAETAADPNSTKVRDSYIKMLSSGSAKYPIDLLKGAGVDMTTSAPFSAAMQEMNATMDEMEKLLETK
ncbi:MAG: oligoendopeptidase F [Elusimicrobiaceae bacterium]|nr:oligoendopeptidase F [Elusimicrobiaceae bacterium]